ncbi:hypothetical protein L484_017871 [Morus notabilis]|uniref:Uncharacterized protein n=1 Tax=Morus notabilis TaxID=981085 RepID=W9SPE0_9ROSA|nr:hypothetical protein L484_017871 [Morus notabilis]
MEKKKQKRCWQYSIKRLVKNKNHFAKPLVSIWFFSITGQNQLTSSNNKEERVQKVTQMGFLRF